MKVCKRCLLNELDDTDYFKSIYEYIDNIPEINKCGNKEYLKRLDICKGCNNLLNGMCKHCGCFVEVRAAKRNQHCPDRNKYW